MSNTISKLHRAVQEKVSQWDREAEVNAKRAILLGRSGTLVTYPSGKQMVRFAEPFKDFGMHYEVSVECWNRCNSMA